MTDTATDYRLLLTETLQKQIIILGPTISLTKARQVEGLQVTDDGRVNITVSDHKAVSIKLLEKFRELSPLLVKKTMKPLLHTILHPNQTQQPTVQTPPPQPTATPPMTTQPENQGSPAQNANDAGGGSQPEAKAADGSTNQGQSI